MGKLNDSINQLIVDSVKSRDQNKVKAYRNLKSKFIEFTKQGSSTSTLKDDEECAIIMKMVKELEGDIQTATSLKREEIAQECLIEKTILMDLLPPVPTNDELINTISEFAKSNDLTTDKGMGMCIKYVKSLYPSINGKDIRNLIIENYRNMHA